MADQSSDSAVPPDPGEAVLRNHLSGPVAADAVCRGWLRLDDLAWPDLTATITESHGSLSLRLEMTGYPHQAPTGQPWDLAADQPLPMHLWPTGPRAEEVFNRSWSPANGNALYVPMDRRAQVGHDNWANEHPGYWWTPRKTVVDYLRLVHIVIQDATLHQALA